MPAIEETSYLVPSPVFFVELLVATLLFGLLVLWPVVSAARQRQPAWVVAIVLLGPVSGILWFFLGPKRTHHVMVAS